MIITHNRITRKSEVIITLVCTTLLKHRGRQGRAGTKREREREKT